MRTSIMRIGKVRYNCKIIAIIKRTIWVGAIVLLPFLCHGQSLGWFESDELLAVQIKTDMRHLLKMSKEDKYQKAKLIIGPKEWKIRMRPRGNFRLENCSFPPITLNFSKTEFMDTSFNQLKKLKLVNACKLQSTYEQYILREFMIYKLFNLLTDYSFRVRLLKLEYIDSKGSMKPIERFGFVIEDADMLARQHGGYVLKQQGLKDEVTNREQMVLVSIFQFMIGNTDWQVAAQQNLKLIKLLDFNEPAPYVVPYDFDYTGMVNATYAIPADVLGIERITQRLYWGRCYSEEELTQTINIFIEKKKEIYAMYNEFPYFDKASMNHSINYLDSFYKVIEDERSWKYFFIKQCNK